MENRQSKRELTAFLFTALLAVLLLIFAGTVSVRAASSDSLTASGRISSSDGVNLRAKPSTSSEIITGLRDKTKVKIIKEVFVSKKKSGKTKRWYYVKTGSVKGYVRSDLVRSIKYESASGTTTSKVFYRAGAGTGMKKKGSIRKDKPCTVVLKAKPKGSGTVWYKIKRGSSYYYVIGKKLVIEPSEEPEAEPEPEPVPAASDEQSEYALKVVDGACNWAVTIANDNSFHYGNGKHCHHNGCYYCGTQPKSKQQYVVQWEKTYCCNPFVTAAFAHGGGEPFMLSLCSRGKSYMAPEFTKSDLFKNLGHPDQSTLKRGDILCNSIHVALYIGNGQLVEAATEDDGVPGSSKWNSSIRVTTLSAKRYSGFTSAFRYIGTGAAN